MTDKTRDRHYTGFTSGWVKRWVVTTVTFNVLSLLVCLSCVTSWFMEKVTGSWDDDWDGKGGRFFGYLVCRDRSCAADQWVLGGRDWSGQCSWAILEKHQEQRRAVLLAWGSSSSGSVGKTIMQVTFAETSVDSGARPLRDARAAGVSSHLGYLVINRLVL